MPIGVVGVGVVAAVGIGRAGHAPEIVVGGGCCDAGDGLARLWGQVGHGHARRLIQRVVLDLLLRRDVAAGGGIRTVPLLITVRPSVSSKLTTIWLLASSTELQ